MNFVRKADSDKVYDCYKSVKLFILLSIIERLIINLRYLLIIIIYYFYDYFMIIYTLI